MDKCKCKQCGSEFSYDDANYAGARDDEPGFYSCPICGCAELDNSCVKCGGTGKYRDEYEDYQGTGLCNHCKGTGWDK